jgi:hypothetical protein
MIRSHLMDVGSSCPENAWIYREVLPRYGHETFAIPRNDNVSISIVYASFESAGSPFNKQLAERRATNKGATEIIQTRGQPIGTGWPLN